MTRTNRRRFPILFVAIAALALAGAALGLLFSPVEAQGSDQAGTVTLSPTSSGVGVEITATLADADGSISGKSWQWSSADSSNGTYSNISGATSRSYTPGDDDVDKYLRARVTYADGHGSGKNASRKSTDKVRDATPRIPIILSAHRHVHHDMETRRCFHTHEHTHNDAIDYTTDDNGNEPVRAGDRVYYPIYADTYNHHGRKYGHGPRQFNGQLHAESASYIKSCNGGTAPAHNHADGAFTRDTPSVRVDVAAILLANRFPSVDEGGEVDLRVKLGSQPSTGTTITVKFADASDPSVTVMQTSLTFTTSNWDTYKTIEVSAAHDGNDSNGEAIILLDGPRQQSDGGDPRYRGVYQVAVVSVIDDD